MTPAMLFVGVMTMFPLGYALWLSFYRFNLARPWVARKAVGFGNYLGFLSDPVLGKSLVITAEFALATTGIQLVAGLLIALLLEKKIRGNQVFRVLFFIPMMMVPVVSGLTWRLMLNESYGVVNWLLTSMGFSSIFWLGKNSALLSVVLAETWQWLPFSILIFSIALSAIPKTYYEAAAVDGASFWYTFIKITLPNLKWAFVIIAIFKISDAVKAFDVIYIMTGGGPGISTQTLALLLQKSGFAHFEMGYASALSFLILAISMIFLLPLVHLLITGGHRHG